MNVTKNTARYNLTPASKNIGPLAMMMIVGIPFAMVVLFAMFFNPKGIVAIEGFEHGVALCEKPGEGVQKEMYMGGVTVWNNGHATFIVNEGHENDEEVKALEVAALIECSKY